MIFTHSFENRTPLQQAITAAYRMDEAAAIANLIPEATLDLNALQNIHHKATELVLGTRTSYQKHPGLTAFLHEYDLSTEEGIALMCLAEALLRIPDHRTANRLISDKIATAKWAKHIHKSDSFFVNAATWSLWLTGKLYTPLLHDQKTLKRTLERFLSRGSSTIIRPIILQGMKIGSVFCTCKNF